MRRQTSPRRHWLWPLVVTALVGVVSVGPRLAEGLPQTARGRLIDAYTGQPIVGAIVRTGDQHALTDRDGTFDLSGLKREMSVEFEATGYSGARLSVGDSATVSLKPTILFGGVFDADNGRPVANATVIVGRMTAKTGTEGIYRLSEVPDSPTVFVKAPGYGRAELRPGNLSRVDVRLTPQPVRAIYISGATFAFEEQREKLFSMLGSTELNAVVIDVKGDRGLLSYISRSPTAVAIGSSPDMAPDMSAILARLKRSNVYTIARIVVFKDRLYAESRPDLAVVDRTTGRQFVDYDGQYWLDPFRNEVWEYNLSLAEEAAALGFDEVQFDYVRFPTEGRVDNAVYSKQADASGRQAAIGGFLKAANDRLQLSGTYVSADIFGYVLWDAGDIGIGQQIDVLAGCVDYLSPMLYPSTFGIGVPGFGDRDAAIGAPYEVVRRSLEEAKRRTRADAVRFRPWLQYFDDYSWQTGKRYGEAEILAQKRAAIDSGSRGWMLWDPTNLYLRGGFAR